MTNLQRWLIYLMLFVIPYFAILFSIVRKPDYRHLLLPLQLLPYIIIIAFGVYATSTMLYRTLTFQDCPLAAKELQEQIQEARTDLISKGFRFED